VVEEENNCCSIEGKSRTIVDVVVVSSRKKFGCGNGRAAGKTWSTVLNCSPWHSRYLLFNSNDDSPPTPELQLEIIYIMRPTTAVRMFQPTRRMMRPVPVSRGPFATCGVVLERD
jgi:hypothetical protein